MRKYDKGIVNTEMKKINLTSLAIQDVEIFVSRMSFWPEVMTEML